jgi:hypothetical protein
MRSTILALSVLAVGLGGCVEKSKDLTASEKEKLKAYRTEQAPSPEHSLDVSLEDKIKLVGYDTSSDEWKPGSKLEVTWYWKCERPLEQGWRLFTHVADAKGNDRLNHDSTGPIRRMYQPGRWQKGEYIKDTQEMTLPEDWSSSKATFYIGLWNGPHRLQVTKGPNDGENRIRAMSIPTPSGGSKDKDKEQGDSDLPTLQATKASGDIEIDGKLDEEAWSKAKPTDRFVNTINGGKAKPKTVARLTWNDDHLYVAFKVQDDLLRSEFDEQDDHLWEQDAVEMMIDPDGDGKNYFELQVSPKGVTFDTRYDSRRKPKPFGDVDWSSEMKAKVDADGKVGDDKADKGYVVEAAIPWKAFDAGKKPAQKPSHGDEWRMNFFVMDKRKGDKQRAAGWSPPKKGDFHVPERFGRVKFVDPEAEKQAAAQKTAKTPKKTKNIQKLPKNVVEKIRKQAAGGHPTLQRGADKQGN